MTSSSAFEAIAAASAAIVGNGHPSDILSALMGDCLSSLGAEAAAILVVDDDGDLRLLCSSSHRAAEIEMLQAQHSEGPCVESIRTLRQISTSGADDLVTSWGEVGRAIVSAGYNAIDAYPMSWQGRPLGGLNVFRATTTAPNDSLAIGRAVADVATLALVQQPDVTMEQITDRIRTTLTERSTVERAKGALAY